MNVLITGSNRGVGLGLACAYISKGAHVIATCRTPDNVEELESLKRSHGDQLKILQLDIIKKINSFRWMKNLVIGRSTFYI